MASMSLCLSNFDGPDDGITRGPPWHGADWSADGFQELVVVETYTKKEKPSEVFTKLLKDPPGSEGKGRSCASGVLFGWWMVDGIMTILGHTICEKKRRFCWDMEWRCFTTHMNPNDWTGMASEGRDSSFKLSPTLVGMSSWLRKQTHMITRTIYV